MSKNAIKTIESLPWTKEEILKWKLTHKSEKSFLTSYTKKHKQKMVMAYSQLAEWVVFINEHYPEFITYKASNNSSIGGLYRRVYVCHIFIMCAGDQLYELLTHGNANET